MRATEGRWAFWKSDHVHPARRAWIKAALLVLISPGCESRHFPAELPDETYPNGHPLVMNEADPTLESFESDLVVMTNQSRANAGLPALLWATPLGAVARAHSAHMPIHFFYDHVNPEGDGPIERLAKVASGWSVAAENIDLVNDGTTSTQVYAAFMNSPEHQANLLSPLVNTIGVGVVRAPHYLISNQMALYVTMDFVYRD